MQAIRQMEHCSLPAVLMMQPAPVLGWLPTMLLQAALPQTTLQMQLMSSPFLYSAVRLALVCCFWARHLMLLSSGEKERRTSRAQPLQRGTSESRLVELEAEAAAMAAAVGAT